MGGLANAHLAAGDAAQAEHELRACLKTFPKDSRVRRSLAEFLASAGRGDEAAGQYRALLRSTPNDAGVALALATVEGQAGHLQAAEQVLGQLVKRQPSNTKAVGELAAVLRQQGRGGEAIARLRRTAQANPKSAETRLTLGVLLQFEGRLDEAEQAYKQTLAIAPDHSDALNNLAFLYLIQDRNLDEAERLARAANVQNRNNGQYLDTFGWVLYRRGEYERAFEVLQAARARCPGDADPVYHLAACHSKLGLRDSALRLAREALSKRGPFPERGACEALIRELSQ